MVVFIQVWCPCKKIENLTFIWTEKETKPKTVWMCEKRNPQTYDRFIFWQRVMIISWIFDALCSRELLRVVVSSSWWIRTTQWGILWHEVMVLWGVTMVTRWVTCSWAGRLQWMKIMFIDHLLFQVDRLSSAPSARFSSWQKTNTLNFWFWAFFADSVKKKERFGKQHFLEIQRKC